MKTGTYNLTLDEFINQTKVVPKMLKIDTDGNELEILKGAQKSLEYIQYIALEMPLFLIKKKIVLIF